MTKTNFTVAFIGNALVNIYKPCSKCSVKTLTENRLEQIFLGIQCFSEQASVKSEEWKIATI